MGWGIWMIGGHGEMGYMGGWGYWGVGEASM